MTLDHLFYEFLTAGGFLVGGLAIVIIFNYFVTKDLYGPED